MENRENEKKKARENIWWIKSGYRPIAKAEEKVTEIEKRQNGRKRDF